MAGCRALTDEEFELARKSFKGQYALRNACLLEIGCRTGFRISELLSLKVSDVIQFGKVKDAITVSARFMKGKFRSRTVVLHKAAKDAIEAYLGAYERKWERKPDPDMYLFKSQFGANRPMSRSQAAKVLHDVFDAHQMQGALSTHSMRKRFAWVMFNRLNKDIVKVQHALGHANISSTAKYLCDFTQEDIHDAILAD